MRSDQNCIQHNFNYIKIAIERKAKIYQSAFE